MRPRVVAKKPSKYGCLTCRIRKVKCDEAKPECQKCLSTGRKCDGYPLGPATSKNDRKAPRDLLPTRPIHGIVQFTPLPATIGVSASSVLLSLTEYERSAYQRFRVQTAAALRLTSPFPEWVPLAEQLAVEHGGSVFWGVVALGAMDVSLPVMTHPAYARQLDQAGHERAMQQYVKSLAALRRYLTKCDNHEFDAESMTLVLISSILGLCFELFRANNLAVMAHAHLGQLLSRKYLKLRSESQLLAAPDPRLITMTKLFEQISLALGQASASSGQRRHHDKICDCLRVELDPPSNFSSIAEATHHLTTLATAADHLRDALLKIAKSSISKAPVEGLSDGASFCLAAAYSRAVRIPKNLQKQLHILSAGHDEWLKAFDQFETENKPSNPSPASTTPSQPGPSPAHPSSYSSSSPNTPSRQPLALRIQHFSSSFNLLTCRHLDEATPTPSYPYCTGPAFAAACQQTLAHILQYLHLLSLTFPPLDPPASPPLLNHHTHQPDPKNLPRDIPLQHTTFSLDLILLPALFIIAYKCRSHPAIRRHALSILAGSSRREGMDYSGLEAFFGRAAMRIEEWRAWNFPLPLDFDEEASMCMDACERAVAIDPLKRDAVDDWVRAAAATAADGFSAELDLTLPVPPHARFCDVVTAGEGDDLLFRMVACRYLPCVDPASRAQGMGEKVRIEVCEYFGGKVPLRLCAKRVVELEV